MNAAKYLLPAGGKDGAVSTKKKPSPGNIQGMKHGKRSRRRIPVTSYLKENILGSAEK
jgi:hypothetical protein